MQFFKKKSKVGFFSGANPEKSDFQNFENSEFKNPGQPNSNFRFQVTPTQNSSIW